MIKTWAAWTTKTAIQRYTHFFVCGEQDLKITSDALMGHLSLHWIYHVMQPDKIATSNKSEDEFTAFKYLKLASKDTLVH